MTPRVWLADRGVWQWEGVPQPTVTWAWFVCDERVVEYSGELSEGCRKVSGEASNSGRYDVQPADWGSWLVVVFTAVNSVGSDVAATASRLLRVGGQEVAFSGSSRSDDASGTVFQVSYVNADDASPPVGQPSALTIGGVDVDVSSVVVSDAVTDGVVEWVVSDGSVFGDVFGQLEGVFRWNGVDYSVVFEDPRVEKVTASSVPQLSVEGQLVGPGPGDLDSKEGGSLLVDVGQWDGFPVPEVSVQWFRCDDPVGDVLPSSGNCQEIIGASGESEYVLGFLDRGKYVTSVVTAANVVESVEVVVPQAQQVGYVPSTLFGTNPQIIFDTSQGGADDFPGVVFRSSYVPDFYSPDFPITSNTWRWYRCDGPVSEGLILGVPEGCEVIEQAPSVWSYQTVVADAGKYVLGRNTVTNQWGVLDVFTTMLGPVSTNGDTTSEPVLVVQ